MSEIRPFFACNGTDNSMSSTCARMISIEAPGIRERLRHRDRVGGADRASGVLGSFLRGPLCQGRSVHDMRPSSHLVPKGEF